MAINIESGSRSDLKRQNIIKSAEELFLREGFFGAGMETLARMVGVSTATLYIHFPSKDLLFREVAERALERLLTAVREASQKRGTGSERLYTVSLACTAYYADPMSRAAFRMITSEQRRFADFAVAMHNRARSELGGAMLRLVTALAKEGVLIVDKPSWTTGQLLGMIEHATLLYGLVRGDNAQPNRSHAEICRDAVQTIWARYGSGKEAFYIPPASEAAENQPLMQPERAVAPELDGFGLQAKA